MTLTCGGVGVEEERPPDIISSVISRPPWLGSRILILNKLRKKKKEKFGLKISIEQQTEE